MIRASAIRAAVGAFRDLTPRLALGVALALGLALAPIDLASAQSRQGRPGGGGHAGQYAPDGRGGGYAGRGGGYPGRGAPGAGYYGGPPPAYAPAPFAPPRYAAPPPRRLEGRPEGAASDWRPAQRPPPGVYTPYGGRPASLGWVIESIGRRSPGRVLDARVEDRGGRPVYRVLWLTTHGRRIAYIVDAETGAVLGGG